MTQGTRVALVDRSMNLTGHSPHSTHPRIRTHKQTTALCSGAQRPAGQAQSHALGHTAGSATAAMCTGAPVRAVPERPWVPKHGDRHRLQTRESRARVRCRFGANLASLPFWYAVPVPTFGETAPWAHSHSHSHSHSHTPTAWGSHT
jgi:hypothetical protein